MSFNTKCSATLKQMPTDPDAPKTKLDKYMDLLIPAGVGLSSTSMLVKKCKQDDDSEDDSKTDKANFHFDNVVAPEKRKNNNGKDIGGCPKDEFMGKLTGIIPVANPSEVFPSTLKGIDLRVEDYAWPVRKDEAPSLGRAGMFCAFGKWVQRMGLNKRSCNSYGGFKHFYREPGVPLTHVSEVQPIILGITCKSYSSYVPSKIFTNDVRIKL
ncbi:hypothetical protein F5146DRAFT_1004274 [Armillaria mellea]|nr:hypothetical protein F5146DRAFT_1004274 [Armillaria mellea]